jgi:hypothetical protein
MARSGSCCSAAIEACPPHAGTDSLDDQVAFQFRDRSKITSREAAQGCFHTGYWGFSTN